MGGQLVVLPIPVLPELAAKAILVGLGVGKHWVKGELGER